ncbi:MAG: hypothetical protein KatS3mg129_0789 [Leptospiraceae bacterium]|nr:MAG: hypothetical protein KatS3mg129_0789 [Leptospiraceae bacterium]
MNNDKELNAQVLKLLDELLNQKKQKKPIDDSLKSKINSLSNKELVQLIQLYTDLTKYEDSTEKKEIPEFYLYRVKDYYEKLRIKNKQQEEDIAGIVLQFFKNSLKILNYTLDLQVQEVPIQSS